MSMCRCRLKFLTGRLQARERPRAGTESIRVDAEALEHRDIEVGQGRRLIWIEGEVLAVSEPAAGQKHRQIPRRVAAGVAEVAAEEHHGAIEQAGALLARVFELGKEGAQGPQLFQLDRPELRDFGWFLAVVRQIVMA